MRSMNLGSTLWYRVAPLSGRGPFLGTRRVLYGGGGGDFLCFLGEGEVGTQYVLLKREQVLECHAKECLLDS